MCTWPPDMDDDEYAAWEAREAAHELLIEDMDDLGERLDAGYYDPVEAA